MKKLIFSTLVLLLVSTAQAKIDITADESNGSSVGPEAAQLTKILQGLGFVGTTDQFGNVNLTLKGSIAIINGGACDNGHQTFDVTLNQVDAGDKIVKTVELNGYRECQKVSPAQKFKELMDSWGGKTLTGNCGLGHCDETLKSIDCTHYPASNGDPASDSCEVIME